MELKSRINSFSAAHYSLDSSVELDLIFFTKLICELDIHKTGVSLALRSEVTPSRSSQILAMPEWTTVPLSQLMVHRSVHRFGGVRLGLSCYT